MKRRGFGWRHRVAGLTLIAAAVSVLFLVAGAAANPVSGAISTTDNPTWTDTYDAYVNTACLNGQGVNCNIYNDKRDVWLSGLPVHAALGAGTYFFAVLSPGGQPNPNDCAGVKNNGDPANLSDTDPCETTGTGAGDTWLNRTFSVDGNGVITYPAGGYPGGHDFDSTNNKIQLFPYDDTPNPGGVYILAVCKVPGDPAQNGGPGVDPRDCKYDAFKVKQSGEENPPATGPTVTKDSAQSFDTEYAWTIHKSATPSTQTVDAGQPATFSYTVTVSHDAGTVQNVSDVTGTIDVFNPNDVDMTLGTAAQPGGIVDELSDGTTCTVDTTGGLVLSPGDNFFTYSCGLSALPGDYPDTSNTATAYWDEQTLSDDSHLDAGSADFNVGVDFTNNLLDNCANVTDTFNGASTADQLGYVCANDDPAATNLGTLTNFHESYTAGTGVDAGKGTFTFTYTRTVNGPTAGSCRNYGNEADFADNSDPQNTGKSTASVQLCSFGPRLTPGYWKNHLADAVAGHAYSDSSCGTNSLKNAGGSCSTNGPFAKQWANNSHWKCLGGADGCTGVVTNPGYTGYKVDTILKAAQVFSAMSCSFSGNAANQNQQAVGCLAGHLLATKFNRNINGSNPCIDPTIINADAFLAAILYRGTSGTYTGITSAQRNTAISLKTALDNYNNGNGCH
jgi:hypothetical protein